MDMGLHNGCLQLDALRNLPERAIGEPLDRIHTLVPTGVGAQHDLEGGANQRLAIVADQFLDLGSEARHPLRPTKWVPALSFDEWHVTFPFLASDGRFIFPQMRIVSSNIRSASDFGMASPTHSKDAIRRLLARLASIV